MRPHAPLSLIFLLAGACASDSLDDAHYCAPTWNGGTASAHPLPTDPSDQNARLLSFTLDGDGTPLNLKLAVRHLTKLGVPATIFARPSMSWRETEAVEILRSHPSVMVAPVLHWTPDGHQAECDRLLWCSQNGLSVDVCLERDESEFPDDLNQASPSWCLGTQIEINREETLLEMRRDLDDQRQVLARLGILQPAAAVLYRHWFGGRRFGNLPQDPGDCHWEGADPDDAIQRVLGSTAVRMHIQNHDLRRPIDILDASTPGAALQDALDHLVRNQPEDTWKRDKAIFNLSINDLATPGGRAKFTELVQLLHSGDLRQEELEDAKPFRLVRLDDPTYFSGFAAMVARKTLRVPGPVIGLGASPEPSRTRIGSLATDLEDVFLDGQYSYAFLQARVESSTGFAAHLLRNAPQVWPGADANGVPLHSQVWSTRVDAGSVSASECALDDTDPDRPASCPLGVREDVGEGDLEVELRAYLGRNIARGEWAMAFDSADSDRGIPQWEITVVDPSFPGQGDELTADIERAVEANMLPDQGPVEIPSTENGTAQISLMTFESALPEEGGFDAVGFRPVDRPVVTRRVDVRMSIDTRFNTGLATYLNGLELVLEHDGVRRELATPDIVGNEARWAGVAGFSGTSGAGAWIIRASNERAHDIGTIHTAEVLVNQ